MSCPICGEETRKQFRPFCSRRCADLDLGKWLTGAYSVPGEEGEADIDSSDEGRTQRPN